MKQLDEILTAIANEHLGIPTLEARHSDSLDFHNVAVWQVKSALEAAYDTGQQSLSAPTPRQTICLTISEFEFDKQFLLLKNHLNLNATWAFGNAGGYLFETYGKELEFVRSQDPRMVWTFMDGDDGQFVGSGFHFVNRVGYLISTVPVPDGLSIEVPIPSSDDDCNTAIDVHELLAKRRQIAVIWSIEDVQEVRPDLDEEQAWEVLQYCDKAHNSSIGLNWDSIEIVADDLFPSKTED